MAGLTQVAFCSGSLVCASCSPHRVVLSVGKSGGGRAERVCDVCKKREEQHGSFAAAFQVAKTGTRESFLAVRTPR